MSNHLTQTNFGSKKDLHRSSGNIPHDGLILGPLLGQILTIRYGSLSKFSNYIFMASRK